MGGETGNQQALESEDNAAGELVNNEEVVSNADDDYEPVGSQVDED